MRNEDTLEFLGFLNGISWGRTCRQYLVPQLVFYKKQVVGHTVLTFLRWHFVSDQSWNFRIRNQIPWGSWINVFHVKCLLWKKGHLHFEHRKVVWKANWILQFPLPILGCCPQLPVPVHPDLRLLLRHRRPHPRPPKKLDQCKYIKEFFNRRLWIVSQPSS